MAWLPFDRAEKPASAFLASGDPTLRRIGIAAFAAHRRSPDEPLCAALGDDDFALRARAIKAVGELGRADLLPETLGGLLSQDTEIRFWAAWSAGLLSGNAQAQAVLREFAESAAQLREQALHMAIRRMDLDTMDAWQRGMAQRAGGLRLAIVAAGAAGDIGRIAWLIDQMNVPSLARAAGEAFTMITGADLALEQLEGKRPNGFQSGPTDEPEDENVEMDADENLPWPDRGKIAAWWTRHETELAGGTRYLLGKPISEEWLEHVLRHGRQRQRTAAALELAIRRPGSPLFEVRAPGFRQQQLLG